MKKNENLSSWVDNSEIFKPVEELDDNGEKIQEIPKHSPDVKTSFFTRHSRFRRYSEVIKNLGQLRCAKVFQICHLG